MPTPNVSIRLSTDGKAEVKNDFAEVRASGESAFAGVADAANQAADATDRAAARQRATWAAQAQAAKASAAQMEAQAASTAMLERNLANRPGVVPLAPSVGGSSAKDSAAVFEAFAASEADAAARAAALRAAIDPLSVAQTTLGKATANADSLLAAGVITTAEHAAAVKVAEAAYKDAAHAINAMGGASSTTIREMLVLTREASRGNFTRMAGSASILVGSLGLLEAILSPVGLSIIAVTSALIAGTVASAMYEAAQKKLTATLIGVGAASGLSSAQITESADAAAAAAGKSGASALASAEAFAGAGIKTQSTVQDLTSIVGIYAALTGEKAADAQTKLAAAMADPAHGAETLNAQLHILDAATLDHIRSLEALGDKEGAVTLLMQALTRRTDEAKAAGVGLTGQFGQLAAGAVNLWTELGKVNGQLALFGTFGFNSGAVQARFAATKAAAVAAAQSDARYSAATSAAGAVADQTPEGRDAQARLVLQAQVAASARGAAAAALAGNLADAARFNGALLESQRALSTFIPAAEKAHQIKVLDAQIESARSPALKASLTAQREQLNLSGQVMSAEEARQKATDAGAVAQAKAAKSGEKHAETLARDAASMEVDARQTLDLAAAYLVSDGAALQAEARRKALTEATKKGIDVDAQAARQLALNIATEVEAGAKSVAHMRDEIAAREAVNAKVAAGKLDVDGMAQALSDEAAMRSLLTLRTVAHGVALDQVNKTIDAAREALEKLHAAEAHSAALKATDGLNDQLSDAQLKLKYAGDTTGAGARALALAQARRTAAKGHFSDADTATFVGAKGNLTAADQAAARAKFIADQNRAATDANQLAAAELSLIGKSVLEHDTVIARLKEEQALRLQGIDATSKEGQLLVQQAAKEAAINVQLAQAQARHADLNAAKAQVIDDLGQALTVDGWGKWADAGRAALNDIEKEFLKLALLNPLKNMLLGDNLPTLGGSSGGAGSLLGSLGSLFGFGGGGGGGASANLSAGKVAGFANGTDAAPAGLAWVGENGPELMRLPGGTGIIPHDDSVRDVRRATSGGVSVVQPLTLDLRGAVMTQDLLAHMNKIASAHANKAALTAVKTTHSAQAAWNLQNTLERG